MNAARSGDPRSGTAVKGFVPVTMLDWEGKVAASVFLGGCNFRCAFCHNPDLAIAPSTLPSIPWTEVKNHIAGRQGWIDGVVIGGGEPTLDPELPAMARDLKALDVGVKIDTNGSRPDVLAALFDEGLVDYVAMDVKCRLSDYPTVTGTAVDPAAIAESIELITARNIDHEFRTTAYPGAIDMDGLEEIAGYLADRGARRYVIQQFKTETVLSAAAAAQKPYERDSLKGAAVRCSMYLPTKVR